MRKTTIEEILKECESLNDKELDEVTIATFNRIRESIHSDAEALVDSNLNKPFFEDVRTLEEAAILKVMLEALAKIHYKAYESWCESKKSISVWDRFMRNLYSENAGQNYKMHYSSGQLAKRITDAVSNRVHKKHQSIKSNMQTGSNFDLDNVLDDIVGLNEIKLYLKGVQAQLRIHSERTKLGLVAIKPINHMIFQGNPGTGKTTIARILGEILFEMGVLKKKKFVETDRSGLVAEYVGQTAIKTHNKINEAIDGILFIDEAYSLANDTVGGFGKEAIDALVKGIEDNRDRLIVILAGYKDEMQDFLKVNVGLQSRFPIFIDFPDYSTDELMELSINLFKKHDYVLTLEAIEVMRKTFIKVRTTHQFGNGRYIRNYFEQAIRNQALRLQQTTQTLMIKDDLIRIIDADLLSIYMEVEIATN